MVLPIIIFLAIEAYLFIYVLIPYFRFDQFQLWDAAGHYFAAWFQRYYLWPHLSGWNPFFFCGFPQGTFYGPVYHYLIALLSFPLSLPLAFKLLTIAAVAILPFAIYYLARQFDFDRQEAALITFLGMLSIAGLDLACGGTLFSQFVVGLGAHSLALPLFLFYLGKLNEQVGQLKTGKIAAVSPLNFVLLTLLAATIVSTHFVVACAAAVAALILIGNTASKAAFSFAGKHGLIAFLLCSFFLLPLAAFGSLTDNQGTILSMGFFLTIPVLLLILLGGVAAALDGDRRFNQTYFTLLAIFAIMLFLDFGQIGFPMHAYRFLTFFMLLAMFLPIKLVFNRIGNLPLKATFFVAFIILLGWQLSVLVANNPRKEINYNKLFLYEPYRAFNLPYADKIDLGKFDGRLLLLESGRPFTPRALEHFTAQTSGNYLLKGLFAESSANAGYVNMLQLKLLDLLVKAREIKQPAELDWRTRTIAKLFNLFQVNYLLSEAPVSNIKLIKRVELQKGRPAFFLYRLGESRLAEVLTYRPYFTEKNWSAAAYSWLDNPDPRILVRANSLPLTIAATSDAVKVVEENYSPPRIILNVKAKDNVPVLVKVAYFPRWQASVNGRPTKIYRVAPSLMLIYGRGEIKLEYQDTLVDRSGQLLTLIGIIFLLGVIRRRQVKNKPASP